MNMSVERQQIAIIQIIIQFVFASLQTLSYHNVTRDSSNSLIQSNFQ